MHQVIDFACFEHFALMVGNLLWVWTITLESYYMFYNCVKHKNVFQLYAHLETHLSNSSCKNVPGYKNKDKVRLALITIVGILVFLVISLHMVLRFMPGIYSGDTQTLMNIVNLYFPWYDSDINMAKFLLAAMWIFQITGLLIYWCYILLINLIIFTICQEILKISR